MDNRLSMVLVSSNCLMMVKVLLFGECDLKNVETNRAVLCGFLSLKVFEYTLEFKIF